ncbi:Mss4-like protein [Exophiala viscosa]|uniref:Mss4-like protein n=1 Tax=Exophiala viscosa TaxID=2486360 RepID=A0AAN6IDR1_9EURO|nr:Mss4-like protein [Exophiala viscosa]KAI1623280.1 Mss4-like protein [Exophiala viscosa]
MAAVHGSCLCGGITVEIHGKPDTVMQCYCDHCQMNASAPFQIVAKYDKSQVIVQTGEDLVKHYIVTNTASGQPKHKVFCSSCGCTLWTIPMKYGDANRFVRVSLIEDGLKNLKPDQVLFGERKDT